MSFLLFVADGNMVAHPTVDTLPVTLTLAPWEGESRRRVFNQTTVRRTLGIAHTPKSVTIQPFVRGKVNPVWTRLAALALSGETMAMKYEGQAVLRDRAMQALDLVESNSKLLAKLGF